MSDAGAGPSALKVKRFEVTGPELLEKADGDLVYAADVMRSLFRMTRTGRLTIDTANRIVNQLGLK